MGLRNKLKKEAMSLSQKAMEKLFADERRAMKIAGAIGKMQQGKQAFDGAQEQVFRQLNIATKSDYKALGKQLSALRRRVRELEEKLERLA
ncbi:MAG: hypothetical protein ACOZIN_03495 [Myxococcota bacterium]